MATQSQKNASDAYRRRAAADGLVRVEVQAVEADALLIRRLAQTLRTDDARARSLRSALAEALMERPLGTAFDVFGSELPDEDFAGVFDQPRRNEWREIDL